MPTVTRSEAKDPLSGLMRKMSLMTKPKTPRTKKTVAPDDMLTNMLSGLTTRMNPFMSVMIHLWII